MAAGMLKQQGENYFQRGQAFVQSKMGFLSAGNLQHHFNIDTAYGAQNLPLFQQPNLHFLPLNWVLRTSLGMQCGISSSSCCCRF